MAKSTNRGASSDDGGDQLGSEVSNSASGALGGKSVAANLGGRQLEDSRESRRGDTNIGLFGLMATFKPSDNTFCEHKDCENLRNESLQLLGVPPVGITAFNDKSKTSRLFGALQAFTPQEGDNPEDVQRIKDLYHLAKTREDAGNHNHY